MSKLVVIIQRFDSSIVSEHDVASETEAHSVARDNMPDEGGYARLVQADDLARARAQHPSLPMTVLPSTVSGDVIGRTSGEGSKYGKVHPHDKVG